jgi:cyanophycin synthetase
MNLFNLGRFHTLVDYAHNPASYQALGGFVKNWPGRRIGVVGGPGDRRDDDFITLGKLAGQMFDEIIVKEDDDTRGRPRGDAAKWIVHGLEEAASAASYRTILDETEAINAALDTAPDDSLVVILPESVTRAIGLIKARNPLPSMSSGETSNGVEASANSTSRAEVDQYAEAHS